MTQEESGQRLEHRLTKLEQGQVRIQDQCAQIISRLDRQNGQIGQHFLDDKQWMTAHDKQHEFARGIREGKLSLRVGDRWFIALLVTAAPALVYAISWLTS